MRGRRLNDEDLDGLSRRQLIAEVKRLRTGVRAHRDSSGHDLCWHHPQLWGLLPIPRDIAVPPWPQFMRGCIAYRTAPARELPDAPAVDVRLVRRWVVHFWPKVEARWRLRSRRKRLQQ